MVRPSMTTGQPHRRQRYRAARWALWAVVAVAALGLALVLAFTSSPWPGVLVLRTLFDHGAAQTSAALRKHVPPGVVQRLGIVYDPQDADGQLDLFLPPGAGAATTGQGPRWPVVVWVHGGGWVSGARGDIGHYASVLAAQGFAVVSVDYTLAPEAHYPTPLRQVNRALAFLVAQGPAPGVDATRLVLAGDSAGAHIAAQVAALHREPGYAQRLDIAPALPPGHLRGVLLFCGPYDLRLLRGEGLMRHFIHAAKWAYSGTRQHATDPLFQTASVIEHVGQAFLPAFISAGNGDPLLLHSQALAVKLDGLGVAVDTLFFPPDLRPPLGHEYQFDLDRAEGREALARAVSFLRRHTAAP